MMIGERKFPAWAELQAALAEREASPAPAGPGPIMSSLRMILLLLRLLPGIVLGVDVVDTPRTGAVELNNRLVIGEEIVGRAWVEGEETTGGQNLSFAVIGRRSHAQARRPREDCDDLRLGMSMRRDVIALRQFQSKGKHAFFARVAVEDRRLRASRHGGRRRSPFDVL